MKNMSWGLVISKILMTDAYKDNKYSAIIYFFTACAIAFPSSKSVTLPSNILIPPMFAL